MEDTRARWERAFVEAVDHDTWGQIEEAIEGYQRLQVAAAAEFVENVLQLPPNRREGIGKLAVALKSRIQELQKGEEKGLGLISMKALKPYMKSLIVSDAAFPLSSVALEPGMSLPQSDDRPGASLPNFDDDLHHPIGGSLQRPPAGLRRGDRTLSLYIERWGFKEAKGFVEPRVVISVRDNDGHEIEAPQETPISKRQDSNYVFFEERVHIQTPLDNIPNTAAIFFEFIHFKPTKHKKSCKAYCYMELDEIKDGPVSLEVYRKPALYTRDKKPSLLTVKPFYLHLQCSIYTEH